MKDGYYKRLLTANIRPIVAAVFGSRVIMGYQPGSSLSAANMNLSFDKTSAEHTADIANYGPGYATALTSDTIELQAYTVPTASDFKGPCYKYGTAGGSNSYTLLSLTVEELVADGFKPVTFAPTALGFSNLPYQTCIGVATIWLWNGAAWECWAASIGKFLRSRLWRKAAPKLTTNIASGAAAANSPMYDSDIVLSNAVSLVVGGTQNVVCIVLQATGKPGDAYAGNSWSSPFIAPELGTAVAKAFGSNDGYGLSPAGRVLTTKVDLLPKGMSFAGHASLPGVFWASIQGNSFRSYLTRVLTRGGRVMTADETTQMNNMRSMSMLAGRFVLTPKTGPGNVWDLHPFGKYQSESGFDSIDVSGQGDTTSAVKARVKNNTWTGWAADTQCAAIPIVKYTWDSTNHVAVWYRNGAVTRYAAVLNSVRVGGMVDSSSSFTAMEADVTLTENQRVAFRKLVADLATEYNKLAIYNTFNDIHVDFGQPVSGVTWVNAHVNSKTTKIASMLQGILNTLMTPFSTGDLASYGVQSEVTGVHPGLV